ncbi:MAG: zinc-binding alcohol dehydrogenase [Gammaproteobacteria bacterium]|nr:zinc-binding alcohol dehydrogenase [Gammaproteobacteria bacterium]
MKMRQIIFTGVERAELLERELSDELKPHQALVETEYTIVSPGTEGRGFMGLPGVGFDGTPHMPRGATNDPESTDNTRPKPSDPPYPQVTGYGQIGRVLQVGADVTLCKPGDRVLTRSPHASMVKANAGRFAVPLPEDFPGEELIFARMAGISVTAIYSSSVKPGDTVLVMGLGVIGNLAAQLFQLAGADVIGSEISPFRVEKAKACGIQGVNPNETDLRKHVMEWTGGRGVQIAVDATGRSELLAEAVLLTRAYGETISLGSPYASAVFDATPMLRKIHSQCIRLIGSLSARWPPQEAGRVRHSLVGNFTNVVNWIAASRLKVRPLLTHLASPADCQDIYTGLTKKHDEYLAAVFDWSRLES